MTEGDPEAGVLKGFEVMERKVTGWLVRSSVVAVMGIAPELVRWGSCKGRVGGASLSTENDIEGGQRGLRVSPSQGAIEFLIVP